MPDSRPLRRAALVAALAVALVSCGRLGPASPEVAAACAARPPADPALSRPIEPEGIDQWLFSEAVLQAASTARCERGLAPLANDPALARAAAYHSGDMAVHGFFGHESPVDGRRTPGDRLRQVGAEFSRVAENLSRISLYAFEGRDFYILDQAACVFARTPDGPPIPRQTYAGAAERVVDGWLDSAGHRRNLLDPGVTRHGAGAAFLPDPEICGELLVTQLLAG